MGGSRGGAGVPLGLSIGGQSSHNFIAPFFFSLVGGPFSTVGLGETVGRLSHPAPLGPRARRPLRQHGGENNALGRPASAGAGV